MRLVLNLLQLFVVLILSQVAMAEGPIVGTGTAPTSVTNPGANATIITSPALNSSSTASTPSANWVIAVQYYCSVSSTFNILTLNTSNATVATTTVPCNVPSGGAGGGGVYNVTNIAFSIPNGYKISVTNVTAVTGTVQATIYYGLFSIN